MIHIIVLITILPTDNRLRERARDNADDDKRGVLGHFKKVIYRYIYTYI